LGFLPAGYETCYEDAVPQQLWVSSGLLIQDIAADLLVHYDVVEGAEAVLNMLCSIQRCDSAIFGPLRRENSRDEFRPITKFLCPNSQFVALGVVEPIERLGFFRDLLAARANCAAACCSMDRS
jgi:hypothetical protein